jgi:signal transduction histidine kinase
VPILLATGALTVGIWAVAAIVGLVSAPPIVVAGGVVALIVVFFGMFAAWRAFRRMTAPIDDLLDAAARLERGDLSARVEERGPPQMRSLARAFNQMSSRLADQDARRRTFLADVAHELRTPLTVIDGQLEAIEDGVYPADAEHLTPIREQTRVLEKLVAELQTVALADAGSLSLSKEPTDLGLLVDDALVAFATQPLTPGVRLTSDVEPDLPLVSVDAARIRQVLANLLSNAIRHVPPYGLVNVGVRQVVAPAAGLVEVAVTDNGPGIPPDLLPTVFERFVKEPGSAGSGLGLAIARDLVEAHGGTIAAENAVGQGTTIRFTLPL